MTWALTCPAQAVIQFQDVTRAGGISGGGSTYGVSWGDLNGDGWPDVWVGDHDMPPVLYVNQRDGTFREMINEVWSGDPRSDYHGAAWADYDADGDQDLIEVADAAYRNGKLVTTQGDDDLLRNDGGRLVKISQSAGITRHQSSRTPLWLDIDRDGRLDLLIVARPTEESRSVLYRQTPAGGFQPLEVGMNENRTRRREYYFGLLDNVLDLRFRFPEDVFITDHQEAAQLADVTGDGNLDLLVFSQPLRAYSMTGLPLTDVTFSLGFPAMRDVADGAIGDFDGDGDNDLLLTRARYILSDYRQPDPRTLKATIYGFTPSHPLSEVKGIDFRTRGPVQLELAPEWVLAPEFRIGREGRPAPGKSLTLDPDDESVWGPVPEQVLAEGVATIAYDPASSTWRIRNSLQWQFVDVIARSKQPIEAVEPVNFQQFEPQGGLVLLDAGDDGYQGAEGALPAMEPSDCMSVAAGDFDNDMDLDAYAVCTSAIENRPNVLLENDGHGRLSVVADAGGAAGSHLGRGDSVAVADFDRDGFLDLFVTNGADPTSPFVADGPHELFRNAGNGNHWLEIDLAGTRSNPPGIGARVEVVAGGVTQFREQSGGMHRFSQNHARLHFGLGANARVDSMTVHWPSGVTQRLEGVPADRILEVTEPAQD